MLTFVLIASDRDEIVDSATNHHDLDFTKVSGDVRFEIGARFEESFNSGGPLCPVAAVDLTGYEDQAVRIIDMMCKEIGLRTRFPSFESEVYNADGPLVAFGEPNIGPHGFIE